MRTGVVHRPPDLPVYQHTPPPSPSAWMGICLMFPSPLLLGSLASQTVSDTKLLPMDVVTVYVMSLFRAPNLFFRLLGHMYTWCCNYVFFICNCCFSLIFCYLFFIACPFSVLFPTLLCSRPSILTFLSLSGFLFLIWIFLFLCQCWTSYPCLPHSRPPPLRACYTMGGLQRKSPASWPVGMRIWPLS